MKKKIAIAVTALAIIALGVALWFFGYHNRKSMDNIPSKEIMVTYLQENGEQYATDKIKGYDREAVTYIWGEPDGMLSGFFGDIWDAGDESIIVYYDEDSKVTYVKLNTKS